MEREISNNFINFQTIPSRNNIVDSRVEMNMNFVGDYI
jgi:hypothetical protein